MNDNSKKFEELRRKYSSITFEKYEINDKNDILEFSFFYEIKNLENFITTWKIQKINNFKYDNKILEKLIFSLGMVELISYYKLTCPELINIKCGYLDNNQINWWKKLLINGLGEFFYTNNIKFSSNMLDIITNNNFQSHDNEINKNLIPNKNNALIPIGGGKDSPVSIEILKNNIDSYCYIINPRNATSNTFEKSSLPNTKLIIADRKFDSKMIELNKKSYLNGHTPFSALVAFSGNIAAYINNIKYVVLSNESSANESTVLGSNVNHQYSKSFEFECDFRNYENKYINSGVEYFSLLRPLAEVKIAELFANYIDYHDIFRSCNVGSKEDKWCGKCAKCLFVYIILSPFLPQTKLEQIFGSNLLNDEFLKEIFDKLIGIVPEKPFECVGSRDEVNACLQFLLNNKKYDNLKLLNYYKTLNMPITNNLKNIIDSYDNNNNLNKNFMEILKKEIKK